MLGADQMAAMVRKLASAVCSGAAGAGVSVRADRSRAEIMPPRQASIMDAFKQVAQSKPSASAQTASSMQRAVIELSDSDDEQDKVMVGRGGKSSAAAPVQSAAATPTQSRKRGRPPKSTVAAAPPAAAISSSDGRAAEDDAVIRSAPAKRAKAAAAVSDDDAEASASQSLFSQESAAPLSQTDSTPGSQNVPSTPKGPKAPKTIPSCMPLTFSANAFVNNTFFLEGDHPELDMSGDTGAVGRFACDVAQRSVTLDLKGYIFQGTLQQSNSFLIVNIGGGGPDAKVESCVSRFFAVDCVGSAMAAESVIEGQVDLDDVGGDNRVEFQSSEDMVTKTPAGKPKTSKPKTPRSARAKGSKPKAGPKTPKASKAKKLPKS